MSRFSDLVERCLRPHFPGLTTPQITALEAHYTLMMRWNPRINLTAITNPDEVVTRHYGESLAVAAAIPPGAWQIIDAGSGAGFPGVPIAIVRPECTVTMLEIDIRKGVFIKETTIGVPNARVRNDRLSAYEPGCDWLVSRALHRQELIPYATAHRCSVALLLNEDEIAGTKDDWSGIEWAEPVGLPWKGSSAVLKGTYPLR